MEKAFIHHHYHGVRVFDKLKDQSCNAQNRRSGDMPTHLFDTCKNSVIPHGNHMFQKSSDMAMATMCAYPSSKYALPHYKCVMRCCAQCPWIYLPIPKTDHNSYNVSPTIRFHLYRHISHCTVHVIFSFDENKQCKLCKTSTDAILTAKIYTRK